MSLVGFNTMPELFHKFSCLVVITGSSVLCEIATAAHQQPLHKISTRLWPGPFVEANWSSDSLFVLSNRAAGTQHKNAFQQHMLFVPFLSYPFSPHAYV
jgi:hypothetical protein